MASSSVNRYLDTKGDICAQSFSGSDADWDSLRSKFEAYADLLDMGDYVDAAKNEINQIDNASLSKDAISCSKAWCVLPLSAGVRDAAKHCRNSRSLLALASSFQ